MSDGHEEREQNELRRQEETKKNREDWIDRYAVDEWEPERRDS